MARWPDGVVRPVRRRNGPRVARRIGAVRIRTVSDLSPRERIPGNHEFQGLATSGRRYPEGTQGGMMMKTTLLIAALVGAVLVPAAAQDDAPARCVSVLSNSGRGPGGRRNRRSSCSKR